MFLKVIISGLLGCIWQVALASVSLELETADVAADETLKVTLTVEGDQAHSIPDLSPLESDFRIIGTQRSMNYTFINGNTRTITQWTLLLMPIKTGKLSIPALRVGTEKTQPQTINVASAKSASDDIDRPQESTMLTANVSDFEPYLNQQVIYTVKLYYKQRLLNMEYHPPQIEDALLIPLGTGKHHQEMKHGYMYSVEEQQYAIFPQKEGRLRVQGPSLRAMVEKYNGLPQNIAREAKAIDLSVKAIPTNVPEESWLPAKVVMLSEQYDHRKPNLHTGDILTRTVSLEAVGAPGQLLPKLNFVGNNFSIYPEPPKETSHFRDGNIVGTSTTKVTYLFNQEGKVTLPEIEVKWFNTTSNKVITTILPSRTIEVTASVTQPSTASKTHIDKQSGASLPSPVLKNNRIENKDSNQIEGIAVLPWLKSQALRSTTVAWGTAGLLMLLWISTLVLIQFKRKKRQPAATFATSKKEQATLYDRRSALKHLKNTCQKNQPKEAQKALMAWARIEYPTKACLTLGELQGYIEDPALKEAIARLSQVLYQGNSVLDWSGDTLWMSLQSSIDSHKKGTKNNSALNSKRKILPELSDL